MLEWLVIGGWCGWLGYQVVWMFLGRFWEQPYLDVRELGFIVGMSLGLPVLVAIGGLLAWRLLRKFRNALAVWFVVVCLLLLWKTWVSAIVGLMLPAYGGHSLPTAIWMWWSSGTSTFGAIASSLFPPTFLVFSIVFWPWYCRRLRVPAIPTA